MATGKKITFLGNPRRGERPQLGESLVLGCWARTVPGKARHQPKPSTPNVCDVPLSGFSCIVLFHLSCRLDLPGKLAADEFIKALVGQDCDYNWRLYWCIFFFSFKSSDREKKSLLGKSSEYVTLKDLSCKNCFNNILSVAKNKVRDLALEWKCCVWENRQETQKPTRMFGEDLNRWRKS